MLVFTPAEFKTVSPSGAMLGLDIGTKTIGVAGSDGLRMIASPIETIARTKWGQDLAKIKTLVQEREIAGIVVGHPINMDGSFGPRAQSAQDTSKRLASELNLPVLLWDERMSTMAVERVMLEADLSRQRRDELVDKLAASYILQGALEALR